MAIPEAISPQELAQKLSMKVNEVISSMMNLGVIATANDNLDQETAILIVQFFLNFEFFHPSFFFV